MNPGRIILVHPTANQNVRETAAALAEADLLAEFWTGIHWRRDSFLDRVLGIVPDFREELRRRSFSSQIERFVRTRGWREWGRQIAGHSPFSSLVRDETGIFSTDAVYHSLGGKVARRLRTIHPGAVYAYDAGAIEVFRAARAEGIKCIYDHPIVYWRRVLEIQREEGELQPEWKPTLLALRDSAEKLAQKDEELALADLVIVPSSFSRDSLKTAGDLKVPVRVLPYGAPAVVNASAEKRASDKLRVLFIGALTQAKGLSYLLGAVSSLSRFVRLTLIGQRVSATVPAPAVLAQHRWISSLPHQRLLGEIGNHDVLVLPSLHEGFGLVILEAMAQGIPVITTAHTGGPDVIADGVDGFLVPVRSADAIADKLTLLQGDPERLRAMGQAAQEKALRWNWSVYREGVIALAREVMAN